MGKTALVIGATGLVGRQLVELLLADDRYAEVVVFARKSTRITHPKLIEHLVDFSVSDTWRGFVRGDVLFSALGTTRAKAGSKARQYEIDYTYQYNFAASAAANGVKDYVLVSSLGANASSPFFYLRIKGELEEAVAKLPFLKVVVLRPAQLYGDRAEPRPGEQFGLRVTRGLNRIGILRGRRPIPALTVARAMIRAVDTKARFSVYTANELFALAGST